MDKVTLEKPTLIIGGGTAGVGKTTFFRELIKRICDCLLINKDTINESFLSTNLSSDLKGDLMYKLAGKKIGREDEHYKGHVRLQSYHCLIQIARENLILGKNPLLDGNYSYETTTDYFEDVFFPQFDGIDFGRKIVWCYCNEDVLRERLEKRGLERDRFRLKSIGAWRATLKRYPILPERLERFYHVKIDTALSLEDNLEKAISYLIS